MEEAPGCSRLPPKKDRYTDFLKSQNPTYAFPGVGVGPLVDGVNSMDEGIIPDITAIQRDFPCHAAGCLETFKTRKDFEVHYNGKHRYICSVCKKVCTSAHLLELHVTETHDAFFAVAAARKPMYECFVDTCRDKFNNESERLNHCLEVHKDNRPYYFPRSKSLNQPTSSSSAKTPHLHHPSSTSLTTSVEMDTGDEAEADIFQKSGKGGKKQNTHISFGQKAVKFIPRQTFALEKKKKQQNQLVQQKSSEENMDFSDIQDSLTSLSSEPSMAMAMAMTADNPSPEPESKPSKNQIKKFHQKAFESRCMREVDPSLAMAAAAVVLSSSPTSGGIGIQQVSEESLDEEDGAQPGDIEAEDPSSTSSELDGTLAADKRKWEEEGKVGECKKLKLN